MKKFSVLMVLLVGMCLCFSCSKKGEVGKKGVASTSIDLDSAKMVTFVKVYESLSKITSCTELQIKEMGKEIEKKYNGKKVNFVMRINNTEEAGEKTYKITPDAVLELGTSLHDPKDRRKCWNFFFDGSHPSARGIPLFFRFSVLTDQKEMALKLSQGSLIQVTGVLNITPELEKNKKTGKKDLILNIQLSPSRLQALDSINQKICKFVAQVAKDSYGDGARELMNLGEKALLPALLAFLEATRMKQPSSHAIRVLGKLGKALPATDPLFSMILYTLQNVLNRQYASGQDRVAWMTADRETARALGEMGEKAHPAIPSLIRTWRGYLYNQGMGSLVRYRVAEALVKIGEKAIPALAQVLKSSDRYSKSTVRKAAIEILGQMGEKAIPILRSEVEEVDEAAKALGRIGEKAIPALTQLAIKGFRGDGSQYDPNRPIAYLRSAQAVADALGQIGEKAIPALIRVLQNARYWVVREAAARALGKMGEKAHTAVPFLAQALAASNSNDLREAAAEALGNIGEKAYTAIPALTQIALKDVNIGRTAAEALGKIGEKAVPALIKILKDNGDAYAALALGRIGKKALPALSTLIHVAAKASQSEGRKAAAGALEKIDPNWAKTKEAASAIPALIKVLIDGDLWQRPDAAKVLEKIDPNWAKTKEAALAIPDLIKALDNRDSNVKSTAGKVLGKIGLPAVPAIPALIKALTNLSSNVRAAAAKALGEIDPNWAKTKEATSAIPDLRKVLVRGYSTQRIIAAKVLGKMGEKASSAIPELIKALDHRSSDVNAAAAEALGKIGEKAHSALPALTQALKDADDSKVKQAIEEALRKIKGQ